VKIVSQPFVFNEENLKRKDEIAARYPDSHPRGALMPLLDLAQRQNGGWLSREAMDYVADMLDMPAIRVYEVATFYSMFHLKPVGKHCVGVCTTTPCWLRNSEAIVKACKDTLGIDISATTADGLFTLGELECLGACVNAPVVQINDDYYEDLDYDKMVTILEALKKGEQPKLGSQVGRSGSEPIKSNIQGDDIHAS
jgi:NADH-quinone oxidoreductase E subunit